MRSKSSCYVARPMTTPLTEFAMPASLTNLPTPLSRIQDETLLQTGAYINGAWHQNGRQFTVTDPGTVVAAPVLQKLGFTIVSEIVEIEVM